MASPWRPFIKHLRFSILLSSKMALDIPDYPIGPFEANEQYSESAK